MALRVISGLRALRPSLSFAPSPTTLFTRTTSLNPHGVPSATFHATSFRWRSEVREEKLRNEVREKILRKLEEKKIDPDTEPGKAQLEAALAKHDESRKRMAERKDTVKLKNKINRQNLSKRKKEKMNSNYLLREMQRAVEEEQRPNDQF
ncbi:hypothetical protein MGN70_013295 [Eutypa lata]|nr:hypothetical protein MGN70_013295 [Eutypa lata]